MQERTLYLVEASNGNRIEVCAVYSNSAYNAKTRAATWLSQRPHLPFVDVRECRDGFNIFFMTFHFFAFPGAIPAAIMGDDSASQHPTDVEKSTGGEV